MGCPKPQWDAFVTKYGPSMADGGVSTASYERKDPAAAAFKVDGYPTVLLVSGASVTKFEGERTPEGLIAFVRENGHAIGSRESFYGEPQTEWGGVGNVVSSTKGTQDGKTAGQQKAQQSGVGGKLS